MPKTYVVQVGEITATARLTDRGILYLPWFQTGSTFGLEVTVGRSAGFGEEPFPDIDVMEQAGDRVLWLAQSAEDGSEAGLKRRSWVLDRGLGPVGEASYHKVSVVITSRGGVGGRVLDFYALPHYVVAIGAATLFFAMVAALASVVGLLV